MKIVIIISASALLWLIWLAYPIYSSARISKGVMAKARAYERHVPAADTTDAPKNNPAGGAFEPMRILVMGDSTAVGAGAYDPADTTAGRLGSKYPDADIENISRNGMQLAELSERVTTLVGTMNRKYDLMLIQIGANDVTHFTALESVRSLLSNIVDEASTHADRVVILSSGNIGLSPVFHFPISAILSKRNRDVRAIYIEEVSKRPNVYYVDLYRDRKDDMFSKDIDRYYAADHFHPTSDGYAVWFEEIEKVIGN